jgi:hypothetical protein
MASGRTLPVNFVSVASKRVNGGTNRANADLIWRSLRGRKIEGKNDNTETLGRSVWEKRGNELAYTRKHIKRISPG